MTKMTESLLKNVAKVSNSDTATISNVMEGGPLGVGASLTKIDSATPLTFSPVVPIITHVPTMFNEIENMNDILKALVERHTKSITGIDFGIELEVASSYTLPDGQEVNIPTKAKRTAISPNMTFPEIQGNLIWNFFRTWISLISHPDTHFSKLAAFTNNTEIDPFVFSFFSMDICFIQFDPTFLPQNIIDAVFVTNMFPKTTGNIGMQKEVGTTQVQERAIDFNGILQHSNNTRAAGVRLAEILKLHEANFDVAPPVADSISEASQGKGLEKEMEEIASEFSAI